MNGIAIGKALPVGIVIGAVISFLAAPGRANTAAYTLNGGSATQTGQTYSAASTDMSGIYVCNGGKLTLVNPTVTTSGNTSSPDNSSFYGLNAGILATSASSITMTGGTVTTSGIGANGVFSTGSGTSISISNAKIVCTGQLGHGVDATAGGTLIVTDVDIATGPGANSAAIATDRGGGTVKVTRGTITTSGADAPGIYSTGAITVTGANVRATASEAAVIEGSNSITLTDTVLAAAKGQKNRGIMILQSMSGDAAGDNGVFTMTGGSYTWPSTTGPAFFVTNAKGTITLKNVTVNNSSALLLKAAADSWGTSGANGGIAILIADGVTLTGAITSDSISSNTVTLKNGSSLNGAINSAKLTIDAASGWIVPASSVLTGLTNSGAITFAAPTGSASAAASYKTLTTASLSASGGTVTLNAYLGADSSPADALIIKGGSATGTTTLAINNVGGAGALTTGNGIPVVSVTSSGTTAASAFTLPGGSALAGDYEYKLYRGGVSASDTANANNWFLRSALAPLARPERALRIAAGVSEATSADLAALNVNASGDSSAVIDMADVVTLVRSASGL
ncbi:MAG TPA: pertactin-like passenger domain-containing protein [Armatimonadota bacterium]|jgi:hypothetical protein